MKNALLFLFFFLAVLTVAEDMPERPIKKEKNLNSYNSNSGSDEASQDRDEQQLRLVGLTSKFCPVNFITLQENESGAPVVYYSRYSSNTTDASIQQEIDQFVKKKIIFILKNH